MLRRELMGNCSPTDAEARLRARRLPLQSAHGTDSVHATTQQEEKLIPTYTTDPPGNELVPSKKPLVTWALMFLSLVSVLLIPDGTNSGRSGDAESCRGLFCCTIRTLPVGDDCCLLGLRFGSRNHRGRDPHRRTLRVVRRKTGTGRDNSSSAAAAPLPAGGDSRWQDRKTGCLFWKTRVPHRLPTV